MITVRCNSEGTTLSGGNRVVQMKKRKKRLISFVSNIQWEVISTFPRIVFSVIVTNWFNHGGCRFENC